jgi:glycosyltransferase involved in cell wall biosynthesis
MQRIVIVLFSVVITLYNKARFIRRALDSVLMQTWSDYEIIIVDDGSTDEGPDMVARYANPRIKLFRQENSGVSTARNSGIEAAKGEFIAFLDADDLWKPDYLKIIAMLIDQYPGAGAYATAYEIILPEGKVLRPKYEAIPPPPWQGLLPSYFRAAMGIPPVWTSATTVPKHVFQSVGGFAAGVPVGEDLDMWGRIALKYPIVFSTESCASYCKEDEHYIKRARHYFTNPEPEFVRSAMAALERGSVKSTDRADLYEYIAKLRIMAGCECLLDGGDPVTARRILAETFPRTLGLKLKKQRAILQTRLPDTFVRFSIRLKTLILGEY